MPIPRTNFANALEVETLADYIGFIKDSCSETGIILFRGQRQDFDLLPKIARIKTIASVTVCEEQMLNELKKRSIPFLSVRIENDWNWLALAQHHGLPTRLLDWTQNPLAALWFVVDNPPVEDHHGVVWSYKPAPSDIVVSKEDRSPFDGTRTEVFQPDHITSRIVAQGGWFTVHKYQSLENRRDFIALNNLRRARPLLQKLIVPAERFAPLRRELDRCGINSSLIYPGLEGLCGHIQWMYSYYSDEVLE